jgi:catechol 2,3-dioxygenase-like lactoylglutathione lyase family enzyme
MAKITNLLHVSILVLNLKRARQFYEGVLGMEASDKRPDLGFEGVWYEFGQQQLHLIENPDFRAGMRSPHGGRDRHVAFRVDSVDELAATLEARGVLYTRSQSGRKALFCRDPDGNALEFSEE